MIQTNATQMAFPRFRMLTEDQISEIVAAAMDILEKIGIKVLSAEARQMFQDAGACVDGEIVRVPQFIVRRALTTAPRGWTIYNRNGERAMEVTGRKSYFGTSTASPNTIDPLTGEYRETRLEDIARSAAIADALENIDWVMPMGSAQDVPSTAADVHEFVAVVQRTTKPIVFCAYSGQGAKWVFDMASEVAGSPKALRERPFLVLYPEPIAPLILPDHVIERIFVAADRFLPQMMGPAMQPGATSPVTLAGAVAQGVAESFMCLATAQLRNPGCPVGLGCNFGNFDMNQGLMGVGNPEMSLALAAQAEVAQSFGLPTWGLAGGTDAKVLDAQAGAEAAFHALAQAQAGLNLIHDVGYMDMSMACGLEQLVLGNEIIGMVKRFLNGIEVSRDRIALEVIARVGHGGHFLGEEHTMQYFKAEQWRPSLFTRKPHKYWEAEGAKDTRTRVREKIQNILETHEPPPLPDSVLNTLERMKQEAEREILGSA